MKPLGHLTVVDLTTNMPGPFCSTILGDLGARVIKVEAPGGDPLRHNPNIWASVNRGKESIVLDLKTSHGRQVLGGLTAEADVALEGWRPGVSKRLGADYETLSKLNPRLIYCSISGFGQEGPWRDRPGHDVNYLALSGYLGLQAAVEGRPWPPGVLLSDVTSGLYATIAVLAALTEPKATRKSVFIDLSIAESALSLLSPEIARSARQKDHDRSPNVTSIPHYGVFKCHDSSWLSLGIVHEDHFWERFCEVAGLGSLSHLKFSERMDRRHELRRSIEDVFTSQTASVWEKTLNEADVPAAEIIVPDQALESPQFRKRKVFTDVDSFRLVSQPMHFSTGSVAPTKGPPDLSEHTAAILSGLGYPLDFLTNQVEETLKEAEAP